MTPPNGIIWPTHKAKASERRKRVIRIKKKQRKENR